MIKLFCNHNWKELQHFEIPSEAENVRSMGYKPNTHMGLKVTYVTDYTCTKCGKLKRKVIKTA